MTGAITVAAAIAGAVSLASLLYVLVTVPLGSYARVFIDRAVIGSGPRLFAFRLRLATVEIRAFPMTSYVTARGMNPYATGDELAPPPAPYLPFLEAPRLQRLIAFVVAPRVTLFLLALAVLGPSRATRATLGGVVEIFRGAFAPLSTGRAILQSASSTGAREGFAVLVALALCKVIAGGLVALPTDLAQTIARRHHPKVATLRAVVMLAMMLVMVLWLVAWITSLT